MRVAGRRRGRLRACCLAPVALALGGAPRAEAANTASAPEPACRTVADVSAGDSPEAMVVSQIGVAATVHIREMATARAVSRAVCGAYRRLSRPACGQLFSEYADVDGTPLAEVLAAGGRTRHGFLASVLFYDGARQPRCGLEGIAATTSPRSHVVFICPSFRALEKNDHRTAETLIIHEMLHSVGLGENPPPSWRINRSVFRMCP